MTKPKYRFSSDALLQVKAWLEEGKTFNQMSKIMGAPPTSIRGLWERNKDDLESGFYFLSFEEKVKSLYAGGMQVNSICNKLQIKKKEICAALGIEYVKPVYKKQPKIIPFFRKPKPSDSAEYGRFRSAEFMAAGYGDGARDAGEWLACKGHIVRVISTGKIYVDSTPLRGVGELMQMALESGWRRI